MHATDFRRTLIIANPAAQSGAAREVAERLQRFLDMTARASQFDLVLTERMGHAKELAAQAAPLLPSYPWVPATILPKRSV